MNRAAVIILTYNMNHVVRQTVDYFNREVKYPFDLFIVDQSSKEEYRFENEPGDFVNQMNLNVNLQGPLGWNLGLKFADSYAEWNKMPEYFAYIISPTSGLVDPEGEQDEDIFTPCLEFLEENEDAVMIQPSYRADSNAMNEHMFNFGSEKPRQVMHLEFCNAAFRGDWMRDIRGWETAMLVHGQDLWFSYLARMEDKTMWVHEGVEQRRDQDNGYNNERIPDSRNERTVKAMETLVPFGQNLLGPNWWDRLWCDYADPEWQNPQRLV